LHVDGVKDRAGNVMESTKLTFTYVPAGPWEDVATAIESEATLVEQPKGKELEYRIIATDDSDVKFANRQFF